MTKETRALFQRATEVSQRDGHVSLTLTQYGVWWYSLGESILIDYLSQGAQALE